MYVKNTQRKELLQTQTVRLVYVIATVAKKLPVEQEASVYWFRVKQCEVAYSH